MVTRRTAKVKGNQFEYDCQYSLGLRFGHENITRTSERGFQLQYDLRIDFNTPENNYIAIECKREAGFNWNKLVKYFEKLKQVSPDAIEHYLLFKANRQPCLVLFEKDSMYFVSEFNQKFKVNFEKHPPIR